MTLVDDFWLIQPGMNTPWNCELLIHRSKVRLVACNVSSRKPAKNSRSQLRIWGWYGKLQLVIWNEQTEYMSTTQLPVDIIARKHRCSRRATSNRRLHVKGWQWLTSVPLAKSMRCFGNITMIRNADRSKGGSIDQVSIRVTEKLSSGLLNFFAQVKAREPHHSTQSQQ